jgi:hypothetical protein
MDSHVDAFLYPNQRDLHVSMADIYVTHACTQLDTIKQLQVNLTKESILFPSLRPMCEMLSKLIPLLSDILDNLRDLKEIGREISPNRTQEMFVKVLQSPLERFQRAMHVLLEEVIVGQVDSVQCCQLPGWCDVLSCGWRRTPLRGTGARDSERDRDSSGGGVEFAKLSGTDRGGEGSDAFLDAGDEEEAGGHNHGGGHGHGGSGAAREQCEAAVAALVCCAADLLAASQLARVKYVFITPLSPSSPSSPSLSLSATLHTMRKQLSTSGLRESGNSSSRAQAQKQYIQHQQQQEPPPPPSSSTSTSFDDKPAVPHTLIPPPPPSSPHMSPILMSMPEPSPISVSEPAPGQAVTRAKSALGSKLSSDLYNENIWHGAYNLAPRGAFLCRVRSVVEIAEQMPAALWPSDAALVAEEGVCLVAVVRYGGFVWQTFLSILLEPYIVLKHLWIVTKTSSCCHSSTSTSAGSGASEAMASPATRHASSSYLKQYIHPLKVALITTLASLLVISPRLTEIFPYGLWASIVVVLIRQDSSASSFHKGYQRVEGTLLGCLFAFSMSRLLKCTGTESCSDTNPEVMIPLLIGWIGVCALFREDPQHGYASLVAGFTPIVVLLGPVREGTQDSAWARVEMTFLGVFLYLLIDNLILPNRSDAAIRKVAMHSVEEVREIMSIISEAMNVLVVVGESDDNDGSDSDGSDIDTTKNGDGGGGCSSSGGLDGQDEQRVAVSGSEHQEAGLGVPPVSLRGHEAKEPEVVRKMTREGKLGGLIVAYRDCLASTDAPLERLRERIDQQQALFALASKEPQLWYR